MCKLGDIIVVNKYVGEDGKEISKHSFIVVDDDNGTIAGLDYSMVASMISSFKSEEDKQRRLSYYGNVEVPKDAIIGKELKKPSYVKANKAYYFNKEKLDYYVFGKINEEFLNKLVKIILELKTKNKISKITKNL